MLKLRYTLYAAIASCAIFILAFAFVIHKPLTVGNMQGYYHKKISYLASQDRRKMVLLAGSNGRFSHRCEILATELGMPCVNMSISVDISMDYQLKKIQPYLNAGDIVYLPLEYGLYQGSSQDGMTDMQLPYILAYDHQYLLSMKLPAVMRTLFYADLEFMLSGLGEMLLDSLGIKRRFTLDTLTQQGDETAHTAEKAQSYKSYIDHFEWWSPFPEMVDESSERAGMVTGFLRWAREHHVAVIGGLPTTFDDHPIPEHLLQRLRSLYQKNDQRLLVLPNKSQYPRAYFFDSAYHLTEEHQIRHSQKLAHALKPMVAGQ